MEDKMFDNGAKYRFLSLERRMGGEAEMFSKEMKHRFLSQERRKGGEAAPSLYDTVQ